MSGAEAARGPRARGKTPARMPEGKLGMIIHRADHAIYLAHNTLLQKAGVTFSQAAALLFVYHNPGCNQRAVEGHLETRGASVTVLLATMAGKGLLRKTRDAADARQYNLSLTAKGGRLAARSRAAFGAIEARLAAGLSANEVDTFRTLLARMLRNLSG